MFLAEPNTVKDIGKIVAPYGITVGDDVIIEPVVQLFAGPGLGVQPVVNETRM